MAQQPFGSLLAAIVISGVIVFVGVKMADQAFWAVLKAQMEVARHSGGG
jgi:hypothetical protein